MSRGTPFGAWPSPITAEEVARGGVALGQVAVSAEGVWWAEQRPAEGGRTVVVRLAPHGTSVDAVPEGFSVRTRVHEYGGGAFFVRGSTLWFSNDNDQRLWRVDPGGDPVPITPESRSPRSLRYADGTLTTGGRAIVCVRERHDVAGEAVNEIVTMPADGSGTPAVVMAGADFYSFPRPSPDGLRICWTAWNHPDMPWDATELWVGDVDPDGTVREPRQLAGGAGVSVFQPSWSPTGVLHFVSDPRGWWNLYRWTPEAGIEPVWEPDAELGMPQWQFGMSTYAFGSDGTIAVAANRDGAQRLLLLADGEPRELELPYSSLSSLRSDGDRLVFVGASASEGAAVVRVDPRSGEVEVLRRSRAVEVDSAYVSVPEAVSFPSAGRRTAHALYYRPRNPDVTPPEGDKPPLLVLGHGGPTGQATGAFDERIQFWTSRGFAVCAVNYGGSTGYGRAYRELLYGAWGVVDVEDCVAAVRYLSERDEVDPTRVAIRGGSAGGYTALCSLAFTDVFAAGANYYGVADLRALARDTHKFESRYLDRLVGPFPEREDVYIARSPAEHAERIRAPVITFQGLEDPVVPPSQSEQIVGALRRNGRPVAYLTFEGESHGFRKAETMVRSLEAELSFYGQVFGFTPADDIDPVEVQNL